MVDTGAVHWLVGAILAPIQAISSVEALERKGAVLELSCRGQL